MRFAVISFFLLTTITLSQTKFIISGEVKDTITKAPLSNTNILIISENIGTVTDSSGKFSLHLKPGAYKIKFSFVGYETKIISVSLFRNNYHFDVELSSSPINQDEINVTGEKYPSSGVIQTIGKDNIEKMPTILSDVLRSVKIMPGVVSNDELSSGYNVRGGNYDQNLIYLNGFEIHRPLLIKEGLEENQSIINQNFVEDMQFFPGGFPADLGDKISSALNVNYLVPENETLSISSKVNLLNLSATLSKNSGPLSWITGMRYSYPSLLGQSLQRKGIYKPEFFDFQLYSRYNIYSNSYIDILAIYGRNKYKLQPESWQGNYGNAFYVDQVLFQFDGSRNYSFNNGFYSIKYNGILNKNLVFTLAADYYNDTETDITALTADSYFLPDVRYKTGVKHYLKSRFEYADDRLDIYTAEIKPSLNYTAGIHSIESGIDFTYSDMFNYTNERTFETGQDSALETPVSTNLNQHYTFRSIAGYIVDQITFNQDLTLNAGARILKYFYSNETLISPRILLFYTPSPKHTFNLNYGYYYQPPSAYELRNNPPPANTKLVSQKAAHYIAGWEYRPKPKQKYQVEIFYKKMDNLIPYNIENLQIHYLGSNTLKGYAYGFDFQYQGEVVKGLKSWIGYSYLNSKEKPEDGSGSWQRSLNDQTHTVKIFLQDRTEKHPEFQVHVRFILGTGLLFHPQIHKLNENTGKTELVYDLNDVGQLPLYYRADMGITYDFKFKNNSKLTLIAEVLNVFDKHNVANYSWYSVFLYTKTTIGVPQLFSGRFFNIGASYDL
ncbi:MAG: TonB-dependent receptor [Ignavibacteriaceae bacterium]